MSTITPAESFVQRLVSAGVLVPYGDRHRPATWCHGTAAAAIKEFSTSASSQTFGDVKQASTLTRYAVDAGLVVLVEPAAPPTGQSPSANTVNNTRKWLDMCCVYTDTRTYESVYYALPAGASEWGGETLSIH